MKEKDRIRKKLRLMKMKTGLKAGGTTLTCKREMVGKTPEGAKIYETVCR